MKLLLLLFPLVIFLISCGEMEEPISVDDDIVDEALKVFVINKKILEDEVLFGAMCLVTLEETGNKNNDTCNLYYITKKQSIEMSKIGLDIFLVLVDNEILTKNEDVFYEVIEIVEQLAKIENTAKALRRDIESMSGSGCIKCAI